MYVNAIVRCIVLLTCCMLVLSKTQAQPTASFAGRIIDSKTKQPVPFASVFMARTLFGTNSKENGSFIIANIPEGKYDVTISSLGYTLKSIPMTFSDKAVYTEIQLDADVINLKAVEVKVHKLNYKKLMKDFETYFIGETRNSIQCVILNKDKIELDLDDNKVLTASCNEPIVIENKALGYRIYYLLKQFKVDFIDGSCVIAGIPRFESLTPQSERQLRAWRQERLRAYYGSINHLMRSLKFHCLKEDNFEVYLTCGGNDLRVGSTALFSAQSDSVMISDCPLRVVYKNETEEGKYLHFQKRGFVPQMSILTLRDHKLIIYNNGYYTKQLSLELDGYYAWSEKIAELMPMEYQPPVTTHN